MLGRRRLGRVGPLGLFLRVRALASGSSVPRRLPRVPRCAAPFFQTFPAPRSLAGLTGRARTFPSSTRRGAQVAAPPRRDFSQGLYGKFSAGVGRLARPP